ncbi:uncharacterized protein VTP21DRAFT_6101 [Calcarisporiella thermophila]|uniref:uncharacterized protein n=1 Tax=Calcarisporiella thermophila TaxID=911321 RepID=UPI00374456F2
MYHRGAEAEREKQWMQSQLQRIERDAMKQYKSDVDSSEYSKTKGSIYSQSSYYHQPTDEPYEELPEDFVDPFLPQPEQAPASIGNDEAKPGEWVAVETPSQPSAKSGDQKEREKPATKGAIPVADVEYEEDEDPEDLRNFKITEKTLNVEEGEGAVANTGGESEESGALFKKRKAGSQGRSRNIRKKT